MQGVRWNISERFILVRMFEGGWKVSRDDLTWKQVVGIGTTIGLISLFTTFMNYKMFERHEKKIKDLEWKIQNNRQYIEEVEGSR